MRRVRPVTAVPLSAEDLERIRQRAQVVLDWPLDTDCDRTHMRIDSQEDVPVLLGEVYRLRALAREYGSELEELRKPAAPEVARLRQRVAELSGPQPVTIVSSEAHWCDGSALVLRGHLAAGHPDVFKAKQRVAQAVYDDGATESVDRASWDVYARHAELEADQ
jgi:hypothetical protein